MIQKLFLSGLIISVLFVSCKQDNTKTVPGNNTEITGSFEIDTITYDVIIKDPVLDISYVDNSRMDTKELINNFFKSVYEERTMAIDFETEKIITAKQLKKMEKSGEINRDLIGKLQFEELWKFNTTSGDLNKEIVSVILAYEIYSSDSSIRFYKPVFKIRY